MADKLGTDDADPGAAPEKADAGRPRGARWGRRLAILLLILAVAGVAGAAGLAVGVQRLVSQDGPLAADAVIIVPRGTPVVGIARLLHDNGAVRHAGLFAVAARWYGRERPLRAGEYMIEAGSSVVDIIGVLQGGEQVARLLTIPEGLTSQEVRALVAAAEALEGEVPEIGEGTILPETYHYVRGESRAEVISRMAAAQETALADLWDNRAPDLPVASMEEALTLASIVERETSLDEERALVAAVFINRLRRGMRLQSDPTVAYGLTPDGAPLARALTRQDLRTEHQYNTYVIDGLPPGPIANPGRASIAAVLNPAETDALFFVADGSGGHAFARTLDEHNRNVARWRRLVRERDGG